jgi:hypothetical protein
MPIMRQKSIDQARSMPKKYPMRGMLSSKQKKKEDQSQHNLPFVQKRGPL